MNDDINQDLPNARKWFYRAYSLHCSAAILYKDMHAEEATWHKAFTNTLTLDMDRNNLEKVFLMLFGLALEVLIKAVHIQKFDKTPRATHKLSLLAKEAQIELDTNDLAILELLSHSIEWLGKYPTPKSQDTRDAFQEQYKNTSLIKKDFYYQLPDSDLFSLYNLNKIWSLVYDNVNEEHKHYDIT